MTGALPEEVISLIRRIGALARSLGFKAYAVGGFVRDLILGVKNPDIDIAVEGDAIRVGRLLARELKASIVVYERFGTCSIMTKEKLKIDLATTRRESYLKPAALPGVQFSSLKEDLSRRDFTINAMAVSIDKPTFGKLIDFFDGMSDLGQLRIRALHEGAFIDDPTRILRAVRFESRFGFRMDRNTEDLIKRAVIRSIFDMVSRQRMRDQFILLLREREPVRALSRMAGFDGLKSIHPGIRFDKKIIRLCEAVSEICAAYEPSLCHKKTPDKWLVYLMALFEHLTYSQVSAICREFVFKRSDSSRLLLYKKKAGLITASLSLRKDLAPSMIYRLLKPLSVEAILAIMARVTAAGPEAKAGLVRARIEAFVQNYSHTKLSIKGDDLKAMGLKGGPKYKLILDKLLYSKIDGKLDEKSDELNYARALIDKIG